jgi:hypothetical protein
MPNNEIYSKDLDTPLPDIKERLKAQLSSLNNFEDIRKPRNQNTEIIGSNPNEQYDHQEVHVFSVEESLEDIVFLNLSQLPHLKALQKQAKNSLKKIIPNEKITVKEIKQIERWYNIQTFVLEAIQFLEGFGNRGVNDETKKEFLLKIYNRNLIGQEYNSDDWVALLERTRFVWDESGTIQITPNNYKKYVLMEGISYRELTKDQFISFDVLELYKKQTPINFDDLVKIAERTCRVRREVREKYKPDNLN